jgi:glycine betaine/proline transport system permease protein
MIRFRLGEYLEDAVGWLSDNFDFFFNFIRSIIDAIVGTFQSLLTDPSFMAGWIFPFNRLYAVIAPVYHWIVLAVILITIHMVFCRFKNILSLQGLKRSKGMLIFTLLGSLLIMSFNLWDEAMLTTALVISAAVLALIIGIPLGIVMAKSDRVEQVVKPILDFMQTMPPFVYLIPAIIFFSVGNVPGVVATVVFALPPAVRFTNLGIRNVPTELVEATESFGSTNMQLLLKVQIPLAKSTILAGVNQVIMLALSMVVIASMVGARGLGSRVYQGVTSLNLSLGFEAGLGIVILAIILDRTTQELGKIGNN